MALETLQEGLCHVLEVTTNVEVIQRHPVIALQVEVLEDEILRRCLETYFLQTIAEH